MSNPIPNCLKCANFYITYEPGRPYGCRALGFKSKQNPGQVVIATSGIPCQLFQQKPPAKTTQG